MDKESEYRYLLSRAQHICSSKEKCISEIQEKLTEWDVDADVIEKIIASLISEKFIDESRYAKAFVNDKIKFAKWGKIKIAYMLRQKKVDNHAVEDALDAFSEEEYTEIIQYEIEKKAKLIRETDKFKKKQKILSFAQSRGYETEILFKLLK